MTATAATGKTREYRVFFLDKHGHTITCEVIEVDLDETAIDRAMAMHRQRPHYAEVEVWCGGARRIYPAARVA